MIVGVDQIKDRLVRDLAHARLDWRAMSPLMDDEYAFCGGLPWAFGRATVPASSSIMSRL